MLRFVVMLLVLAGTAVLGAALLGLPIGFGLSEFFPSVNIDELPLPQLRWLKTEPELHDAVHVCAGSKVIVNVGGDLPQPISDRMCKRLTSRRLSRRGQSARAPILL